MQLISYFLRPQKYFQDLLSQHIFFCQINFTIIYLVEITYYFEFRMVKLIYFIVLTHFFQINQLKKVSDLGCLNFKLNQQYFFFYSVVITIFFFCQINLNNLFSSDNI